MSAVKPTLAEFTQRAQEHYDAGAHHHSHHPGVEYDKGAFRHYHRLAVLLQELSHLPFGSALDVGCAEGFFMKGIAERFGADLWGVDLSPEYAKKAALRLPHKTAAADGLELPFENGAFDLVYSTETLEHVYDPAAFIAEMKRVARHFILITTPVGTDADAPDWNLEAEGHVQVFDRPTLDALLGRNARVTTFRFGPSFGAYKLVGRHLGRRVGHIFIGLDQAMSSKLGQVERGPAMVQDQDWMVMASGDGHSGSLRWVCPACKNPLTKGAASAGCSACGAQYPVTEGIVDFTRHTEQPCS